MAIEVFAPIADVVTVPGEEEDIILFAAMRHGRHRRSQPRTGRGRLPRCRAPQDGESALDVMPATPA
jgi:hypothetical protein